ncbi:hypothetical protein SAMN05216326_10271 [Nitrosomonas marina]|uniref:Uncharacterized protein n=1 Tax=Nitrosomonas marina TaxID=917 RepID=A0A1H9YM84_9PROT|nr:hypothetical protein [Nitrosomonas marina]SES70155.1 hypothetical protein SAMN05216326_10271 [Nitrosomonas marina]
MIVTDIQLPAYRYLPGVPVADTESLLLQEPEWAALILKRFKERNMLAWICGEYV